MKASLKLSETCLQELTASFLAWRQRRPCEGANECERTTNQIDYFMQHLSDTLSDREPMRTELFGE